MSPRSSVEASASRLEVAMGLIVFPAATALFREPAFEAPGAASLSLPILLEIALHQLHAVHDHLPDIAVLIGRLGNHEGRAERPHADPEVVAFEALDRRAHGSSRLAVAALVFDPALLRDEEPHVLR